MDFQFFSFKKTIVVTLKTFEQIFWQKLWPNFITTPSLYNLDVYGGKYQCTVGLLFDWFGLICMRTEIFCSYLQSRLIQTSQTGGQRYSDTSPFSIPWPNNLLGQTFLYSHRCLQIFEEFLLRTNSLEGATFCMNPFVKFCCLLSDS